MEKNPDFNELETVETVETAGVTSHVLNESEMGRDVVLGHVIMMDFEGSTLAQAWQDVMKNDSLPLVFFFKSSENNLHGLCPVVRSVQEVFEIKESLERDDFDHAEIGWKKGQWTLRTEEKGSKGKPEFLEVYVSKDNFEHTYSRPHLEIIHDRYDVVMAMNALAKCTTVGDGTYAVGYRTRENNHELDGENNG